MEKRFKSIGRSEDGVALVQVVLLGGVFAIIAFFFTQYMVNTDAKSMRIIRRHENLNFSTAISDYVNDRDQVRSAASVVDQVGAGAPVQYQ